MARKTTNYINNKTLYTAMIDYKSKLKESIRNDTEKPRYSNYIGESIMLICNNLAKKPNFSGYTYKQEMISDGIIDCVSAIDNFDPDKTNNPFAYFTQIAWNAFLRRIHKEKKQTYIKHKNFENYYATDDMDASINDVHHYKPIVNEFSSEVIRSFENTLTKVKKPAKIKGIEKFMENEND